MKKVLVFIAACCMATPLISQKITVTNGSVDFVKNQKVLQFAFTYENMTVGNMTETRYVEKKVSDYNTKEPGRGDRWQEAWRGDREGRFVPKFKELFDKNMEDYGIVSDDVNNQNAEYRIEINTDFTEPGFNVGVVRRNAAIHLTCKVFNIATGEEAATIKVNNASANNFWGTDFDTGFRIQECYAKAGRELAKFFVKKAKLSKTK
ncbi:MAG: hypothetical protein LBD35_07275 [Prevotellaceae bacterium]|jgi:hypothetical protein|nr:hypothetical protein [Prevotellaceae bacterium]